MLTEMVGMAAGRDLLADRPLESGPLRAASFNGEETQDELDRKVAAIMQRYGIKPEDCAGRLWVVSTRDKPIRFAVLGPKGNAVINDPVVDAVAAWCEARSIDVFGVDPLVSFHQVRENEAGDMDLLFKEAFGRIAGKERRAVDLAIHPRKALAGDLDTTISDLRGTSAQEAALRIARVFNFMTGTEAAQLSVIEDNRRLHIRIEGGKGGPGPIAKATWVKIETEDLPNGDTVAVATSWKPPDAFADLADASLAAFRRAAGSLTRADVRLEHRAQLERLADHFEITLTELVEQLVADRERSVLSRLRPDELEVYLANDPDLLAHHRARLAARAFQSIAENKKPGARARAGQGVESSQHLPQGGHHI